MSAFLSLLRVDVARVIGEQRNGFVGGDYLLQDAGALELAGPEVEAILAAPIFGGGIFAAAGADESIGIFGSVHGLLENVIVELFSVAEFAQEIDCQLAQTRETVGILVEIAEHVIVLGAEIVVASIFGEDERIEEELIAVGG